jgi:hypothetical protein
MRTTKSAHKWFVLLALLSSTALYGGDLKGGRTRTGNETITGGISQTGNQAVTGDLIFNGDEASTGNTTRAQDYNSSRKLDSDSDGDSILEEPRDSPDNDCDGIVEVSPMPGGKVKIKVTCND